MTLRRLGADPGGTAGPVIVLGVAHGEFPRVSSLHPEFRPGMNRLKATIEIPAEALRGRPEAGAIAGTLISFLPSLSSHRCCGSLPVERTFFTHGAREGCAARESDPGVDVAHLVEHVTIDLQHFVGRMRICSGVTCGWISPLDRYDIFVECPEEKVGRTCFGVAVDLVNDLLDGLRPDPRWHCLLGLARLARDHAGSPVGPRLDPLRKAWGRRTVSGALEALRRRGFLDDSPASFNFSGERLLAFIPERWERATCS